jgi:hypothetical protein
VKSSLFVNKRFGLAMLLVGGLTLASGSAAAQVPVEVEVDDHEEVEVAEDESDWIAFPVVAYSPETSLLFAATSLFVFPAEGSAHPSTVAASAVYTLRNQATVIAETDWIFDGADWEVSARMIASSWLLDYFVTPSQPDSFELEYRSLGTRAIVRRRLVSEMYIGIGLDGQLREFTDEPAEGPGIVGVSVPTLEHRFELRWDTRDSRIAPQSGWFGRVGTDLAPGYGDTPAYWRWQADLRAYKTWSGHTMAGRARFEQNSRSTPFFKQSTVGGMQRLRGVLRQRFRDDWSFTQQFEYRTPLLLWRFGLAAFAGYGAVGGDGDVNHVVSGGAGLRFLVLEEDNVSLRLDGGVSTTDTGVYLSIGEAF